MPHAAYCPQCGTPLPAPGTVPPPPGEREPAGAEGDPLPSDEEGGTQSAESRHWAVGAHLSALIALVTGLPSLVGPLVVWLLKREGDAFVEAHAREALNFNLSLLVYVLAAIGAVIASLGLAVLVLLPLALVAFVGWLIVIVVAAGRAGNGQYYRYPLTIRFL